MAVWFYLKAALSSFQVVSLFFLLDLCPRNVRKFIIRRRYPKLPEHSVDEFADSKMYGGWHQFISIIEMRLCDWQRKLDVGEKMSIDIPLVDFSTKKSLNLQTLIRSGVPLVLNFGSCT